MSNYFPGFSDPTQNWTKVPNVLFDCMAEIDSLAELKAILYILRHTWGFGDHEKRITLDEFMHGRKRRDGSRLDAGTGLSNSAVQQGLKLALAHGFIEVEYDRTDRARVKKTYRLHMSAPAEIRRAQDEATTNQRAARQIPASGAPQSSERSEKDTRDINLGEKHLMGAGAPGADPRNLKNECSDKTTVGARQVPRATPDDGMSCRALPSDTLEAVPEHHEGYTARTATSERSAQSRDPLFDAIADVCRVDPATAGASIGKVAATLRKASPPYTPEDVYQFGEWWESDNWRRRLGPPSVWKLCESIGMLHRASSFSHRPGGGTHSWAGGSNRYAKRNSLAEMLEEMRTPKGREALIKRANEMNWWGGLE